MFLLPTLEVDEEEGVIRQRPFPEGTDWSKVAQEARNQVALRAQPAAMDRMLGEIDDQREKNGQSPLSGGEREKLIRKEMDNARRVDAAMERFLAWIQEGTSQVSLDLRG